MELDTSFKLVAGVKMTANTITLAKPWDIQAIMNGKQCCKRILLCRMFSLEFISMTELKAAASSPYMVLIFFLFLQ